MRRIKSACLLLGSVIIMSFSYSLWTIGDELASTLAAVIGLVVAWESWDCLKVEEE